MRLPWFMLAVLLGTTALCHAEIPLLWRNAAPAPCGRMLGVTQVSYGRTSHFYDPWLGGWNPIAQDSKKRTSWLWQSAVGLSVLRHTEVGVFASLANRSRPIDSLVVLSTRFGFEGRYCPQLPVHIPAKVTASARVALPAVAMTSSSIIPMSFARQSLDVGVRLDGQYDVARWAELHACLGYWFAGSQKEGEKTVNVGDALEWLAGVRYGPCKRVGLFAAVSGSVKGDDRRYRGGEELSAVGSGLRSDALLRAELALVDENPLWVMLDIPLRFASNRTHIEPWIAGVGWQFNASIFGGR